MHCIFFFLSNADPSPTEHKVREPRVSAPSVSHVLPAPDCPGGIRGARQSRECCLRAPADPKHRASPQSCVIPPLALVNHGQKREAASLGKASNQNLQMFQTSQQPFILDGLGLFTANSWRCSSNSHVITRMLISSGKNDPVCGSIVNSHFFSVLAAVGWLKMDQIINGQQIVVSNEKMGNIGNYW